MGQDRMGQNLVVVGLDPGASFGIAAVTRDEVAWNTLHLPSWRTYESSTAAFRNHAGVLSEAIDELVSEVLGCDHHDVVLVVEDSRHAKGLQHAAMTGWHMALVAIVADEYGAKGATTVAPSTWQWGTVGAQGRDAYVRYATELTGGALTAREHDAAAAICMAQWGWEQHHG